MTGVREPMIVVTAQESLEGAGFPVHRPFPQPGADMQVTDPFLLLDQMGPVDYAPGEAKGAPDHPHRGFETVTYVLEGAMEHRDSTGGGGVIGPGDTQWMTAGAGLVHSEMPLATTLRDGGRMHGVQLWVNLPAVEKRVPPRYQLLAHDQLTRIDAAPGVVVRLIAGELAGHRGPGDTHTPIVYAHATLQPRTCIELPWPQEFNALVYALAGRGTVGDGGTALDTGRLAVLGPGDRVVVEATDLPLDALLLGGRPIREPVAWYGPFVMNTKDEIIEAIDDFEHGRLGRIAPLGT